MVTRAGMDKRMSKDCYCVWGFMEGDKDVLKLDNDNGYTTLQIY